MKPLGEPETWPFEEPCAECGGARKVRSSVRRLSTEEPHEVEHDCPLCGRATPLFMAPPGALA